MEGQSEAGFQTHRRSRGTVCGACDHRLQARAEATVRILDSVDRVPRRFHIRISRSTSIEGAGPPEVISPLRLQSKAGAVEDRAFESRDHKDRFLSYGEEKFR